MSSAKAKMSNQVAAARARMMQLPQGSEERAAALDTYQALKSAYNAAFTTPVAAPAAAKPKPAAAPAAKAAVAKPVAKTNGAALPKAKPKPGTAVGHNAVVIAKKKKSLSSEDMEIADAESIDGPSDGEEDAVDPEVEAAELQEEMGDFVNTGSDEEREEARIENKQHAFRVSKYLQLVEKKGNHAVKYLQSLSPEARQMVLDTVAEADEEEVEPEDEEELEDGDYVPPASDAEDDDARELPVDEEDEAPVVKKAVANGKPKKSRECSTWPFAAFVCLCARVALF